MEQLNLTHIADTMARAVDDMLAVPVLGPGRVLVIGCSTSEVKGQDIGSASDLDVASRVLEPLLHAAQRTGFDLAVQCCEHLNRALVVERAVAERLRLPVATIIPVADAGGALAAVAMERLAEPVVVEAIQADAGLDVGHTLIGMHVRPVAVPLRLGVSRVGMACLVAAASRPRLIGGARGRYPADRWGRGVC